MVSGTALHGVVTTRVLQEEKRNEFIADMLAILGDCRMFLLYDTGDTTTSTSEDRNARTITHDATIGSNLTGKNWGYTREMDGSADQGDVPDNADFSFGDGANDSPFSVVALVDTDVTNAKGVILSKWSLASAAELREWQCYMDANGDPTLELYDESANAAIGRRDDTPLVADTFTLLGFTYDGSGANTGVSVFLNAVLADDNDVSTGTYVAMENTATVLQVGYDLDTTPADANLWNGDVGFVALCAKELTVDEMWRIKELVNGFYGLTL